jgi:hypothetical protein
VGDGRGAAPHTPDACAQVVLSHCAPDVQRWVSDAMPRGATCAPLAVLPGSLRLDESVDQRPGLVTANNRLRNEVTWTSQGDWELRRPVEVPEEVRAVRPAWGAL